MVEKIKITAEQFNEMVALLAQRPTELMLSPTCRQYLARDRWTKSQHIQIHGQVSDGTMPGAVAYNRRKIENAGFGSMRRTDHLIGPLAALEPVHSSAKTLTALSIGPRTEMELLHLIGIGFEPENIRAIDLVSSSPLIDAGDMHDLPYPDRSFNVVISGWAIPYSNRPQRCVDEMIRVCTDGGLIAIGISFHADNEEGVRDTPRDEKDIDGTNYRTVADFQKLIGKRLHRTLFQQDPADMTTAPVMIIAQIKHAD